MTPNRAASNQCYAFAEKRGLVCHVSTEYKGLVSTCSGITSDRNIPLAEKTSQSLLPLHTFPHAWRQFDINTNTAVGGCYEYRIDFRKLRDIASMMARVCPGSTRSNHVVNAPNVRGEPSCCANVSVCAV